MCAHLQLIRIVILTVFIAFSSLMEQRAMAVECGNISAEGQCIENDTTLQWCADGELMTVLCPDGEICAKHEVFQGGAGCIDPAETPCGDIPASGQCTTAGNVVWCLEGQVAHEPCTEGTSCLWDEANAWFDCLPEGGGQSATPRETQNDVLETGDGSHQETSSPDVGPIASDGQTSDDADDAASLDNERTMDPSGYESDIEPSGPTPYIQSGEAGTESNQSQQPGCAAQRGNAQKSQLIGIIWLFMLYLYFRGRRCPRFD